MNAVLNYKINRIKNKYFKKAKRIKEIKDSIDKLSDEYDYVAIHNPNWLGVSSSTKELFKNTLPLEEIYTEYEADIIADELLSKKYKTIIFSAFMQEWQEIIRRIKEKDSNVKVKVIWHGGNALLSESQDFILFDTVLTLAKEKLIDQIAFVKETSAKFYKEKGYNTYFLMNTVKLDKKIQIVKSKHDNIKVGMYFSGNRWVKNNFNQISAVSLLDNAELDYVAINYEVERFASQLGLKLNGEKKNLKRNKLLERMAKNDITVYTTFTECAPMIPLESFEVGVPCITGNNHHYWKNTELEKYLVVDAVDDIYAIKEKIEYCLKNKEKVMKLYKEWKEDYDKKVQKNIDDFMKE